MKATEERKKIYKLYEDSILRSSNQRSTLRADPDPKTCGYEDGISSTPALLGFQIDVHHIGSWDIVRAIGFYYSDDSGHYRESGFLVVAPRAKARVIMMMGSDGKASIPTSNVVNIDLKPRRSGV
ncbi:hypothetical protein N7530_001287 [Penicillium desertorum]|uniref:Uncharacterized protein n=1 Tax=Penicillium desertorum TaxID=1303715 RepID=A0A9W9X9T6_9EURO|nr:hypothetical protein N7530_001287 [Penicillium desertorum]